MTGVVKTIINLVLIVAVVLIALSCVKVIKQSKVGIIMRLGKFRKEAKTGVHFLVPFIDRMAYIIDLRELVVDFPPQPVITKDNVTMQIDTVVYYKVTDPVKYVFEIANPISAIENLTATTLRNIIGELDLDETLTSRDIINAKMRTERERREAILQAEGNKSASILQAEGEKQSAILRAEAKKEAMIREAEGKKQSAILVAEGEAEAIRETAIARATGEAEMIRRSQEATAEGLALVFKAMKEADIDDNMLALKSMEALEKLGQSESAKLVLPSDTVGLLGTFKGIKEVMEDAKEN